LDHPLKLDNRPQTDGVGRSLKLGDWLQTDDFDGDIQRRVLAGRGGRYRRGGCGRGSGTRAGRVGIR
jgi:hypothetical protein